MPNKDSHHDSSSHGIADKQQIIVGVRDCCYPFP